MTLIIRSTGPGYVRALCMGTLVASIILGACTAEDGVGQVKGELDVPNCWTGPFDLGPTFFAAAPFRRSLQLRIQRGSDFQTYADAIQILIDDIDKVRGTATTPSQYGQALPISLPVGVSPPGKPIVESPNPPNVHVTVLLQQSCRTQNIALFGEDGVALNADGSCTPPAGTDTACDASSPVGHSTITFSSLFNGNATESSASERLSEGAFDVFLADPRVRCPSGKPRCLGRLRGDFRFYFERSRPAQPFP